MFLVWNLIILWFLGNHVTAPPYWWSYSWSVATSKKKSIKTQHDVEDVNKRPEWPEAITPPHHTHNKSFSYKHTKQNLLQINENTQDILQTWNKLYSDCKTDFELIQKCLVVLYCYIFLSKEFQKVGPQFLIAQLEHIFCFLFCFVLFCFFLFCFVFCSCFALCFENFFLLSFHLYSEKKVIKKL